MWSWWEKHIGWPEQMMSTASPFQYQSHSEKSLSSFQ